MIKTIAVDSGKYATKAVTRDKNGKLVKLKFRTKMDETDENRANDSQSCVFEYIGKKYLIGEEAEFADFGKSKAKDIHKLSTYAAIGQLIDNGDSVNLVIGCPLSIYNNVDERAAYKEFMVDSGEIEIILNGSEIHFTIKEVLVCPEGSGFIFRNPSKYKDATLGIIDIGGLNTNCCVYKMLTAVKSTSFTTNLGANILRNELMQKLNSEYKDDNIQEYLMESILRCGFIKSHPEDSKDIIAEFRLTHVKKIMHECEKKGWDIKNIDVVFIGGGSILLKNEIMKQIPDAEFSEMAEFDNAIGFLEIGGIRFES